MKRLLHTLTHALCINAGYVDHEQGEDGAWWIGFRCAACGELQGKFRSRYQDKSTNRQKEAESFPLLPPPQPDPITRYIA